MLCGLLLTACFPKINFSWLVWIAIAPLVAAILHEPRPWRAFWLGYVTGFVFLSGSCYWFVEVMEVYGKLSPPLAWGVQLLFAIVFSIFFAGFAFVEGLAARRSATVGLALAPFLWVAMEIARTFLITGVPWNLLGYAVQPDGVRQVASVTGVYGLSFLAAVTSTLVVWVCLAKKLKRPAAALGGWVVLLVVLQWLLYPPALPPGSNRAFLVQPNVPLDESALDSWEPWKNPAKLNELVAMSLNAAKDLSPGSPSAGEPPLLVWAENPAPFYFTRDPIFHNAIVNLARDSHAYVIFNTVTFIGPDNSQPRNSAIVLDPEGRVVEQYDKIHLVPFGEYVPEWAFPGKIGKITSEVGNYVPGTAYRVAQTPEGTLGAFICYEAIFPQIARRLAHAGAGVLVNVSNDAWYGDSAAAFQHLQMARLRAVENRRYLLRATNDGITSLIDPYGRVVEQVPRHRQTVMPARFSFRSEQTFYTAHGDIFAWFCIGVAAALLVGALVSSREKSPRDEAPNQKSGAVA